MIDIHRAMCISTLVVYIYNFILNETIEVGVM